MTSLTSPGLDNFAARYERRLGRFLIIAEFSLTSLDFDLLPFQDSDPIVMMWDKSIASIRLPVARMTLQLAKYEPFVPGAMATLRVR